MATNLVPNKTKRPKNGVVDKNGKVAGFSLKNLVYKGKHGPPDIKVAVKNMANSASESSKNTGSKLKKFGSPKKGRRRAAYLD
jgi:hypothetical protein